MPAQAYEDFPQIAELVNQWNENITQHQLVNRFIYDIVSGFRMSLNTLTDQFDHCDREVFATSVSALTRRHDGGKLVHHLYDVQRVTRSHVTLLERSRVVVQKYFKSCRSKDPFKEVPVPPPDALVLGLMRNTTVGGPPQHPPSC